jgi:outer membrane protein assembly factor BamD (BamD/ComL family)
MNMKQVLLTTALLCTMVLSAQYQDYSQMGKTPAELKFIDDPLKIELKEPSWFWHNPEKKTVEDQLAYAMNLEQEGKWKKAVEAYNDLVHEWHATPEALTAQLSIARLNSINGATQEAYDADIYLLAHFAGRFELEPVLRDAVAQADLIATRDLGRTFRHHSGEALRANYERIIHFAPRWREVPKLLLKIADIYVHNAEYASAITICDRIIIDWPNFANLDAVVATYCEACRKQADVWRNDTGRLAHLEDLIQGACLYAPDHPMVPQFETWKQEIFLLRRDRSYEKACFYDNPKAYSIEAAIESYKAFLRTFPDAPQAESVRKRLAELSPENAQ